MRIRYKQRYGITLVSLFNHTLVGLTSIRRGDKYDKNLGFAIALVKAHSKLNKREQKLYDSLSEIKWKTVNLPIASMGTIVMVALQYRQAIGHVKTKYRYPEWDHMSGGTLGGELYEDVPEPWETAYPVIVTQNDRLVCEVAEAFGKRLLKMAVL